MKSHIDEMRDQRFIPDQSVEHRHDDLDLVFYITQKEVMSPSGLVTLPVVVGYEGRRKKPCFYLRFQSEERKNEYIKRWLEGRKRELEVKRERSAEQRSFETSLKVDSILSCSWGWEQTNVEFWQVIEKKSPKTVVIREISKRLTDNPDDNDYNGMAGKMIPIPGVFLEKSEPVQKRVRIGDYITFENFRRLTPWNGKSQYCSWYG